MANLGTFCNKCSNFMSEDRSCSAGLIEIFKDRGAKIIEKKDFAEFNVSKVNYRSAVNPEHEEKDKKDDNVLWIDRACPIYNKDPHTLQLGGNIKGTILLIANNAAELKKTVDKIQSIESDLSPVIPSKQFNLVVVYKNIKMADLLSICGNTNFNYKCWKRTHHDMSYAIYKAVCKYGKNGYLFSLECDKDFDKEIFRKVDFMINHKLFRVMHVSGSDKLHESVSMMHIYKYIKGDLGESSFSEKLDSIAEEEQIESQNFTWEFINEQYQSKI